MMVKNNIRNGVISKNKVCLSDERKKKVTPHNGRKLRHPVFDISLILRIDEFMTERMGL